MGVFCSGCSSCFPPVVAPCSSPGWDQGAAGEGRAAGTSPAPRSPGRVHRSCFCGILHVRDRGQQGDPSHLAQAPALVLLEQSQGHCFIPLQINLILDISGDGWAAGCLVPAADRLSRPCPPGPQRVQLLHGPQPDQHGQDRGAATRHGVRGAGASPHRGRLRQVQRENVLPDADGW